MSYALHDPRVLDVASREAQASKALAVLSHFAAGAGLRLAGSTCLDIGCSAGIITRGLAPHVRRMTGVDVDSYALARAAPAASAGIHLSFAAATGKSLPFAEGTFDLALCNQVYQYVSDVARLLAEIHRVLRAGGACYFTARNLWGVSAAENRLPFLDALSPRAAAVVSHGSDAWRQRAGTLWPYRRLRRLAAQSFTVLDYTTLVLSEPSLAQRFVPARFRRAGSRLPSPLLALAKPLLPTHIWVLQKRA